MATSQQVFATLSNYINGNGGQFSQWHAGISSDPRQRLFNDHNVDEHRDAWAYDFCPSDSDARAVEEALIHTGCKGGGGGATPRPRRSTSTGSSRTLGTRRELLSA